MCVGAQDIRGGMFRPGMACYDTGTYPGRCFHTGLGLFCWLTALVMYSRTKTSPRTCAINTENPGEREKIAPCTAGMVGGPFRPDYNTIQRHSCRLINHRLIRG